MKAETPVRTSIKLDEVHVEDDANSKRKHRPARRISPCNQGGARVRCKLFYLRDAILRASAAADSFSWWSRWFITVTVK